MPEVSSAPIAINLALWINAARRGAVTQTDAINACETLTAETSAGVREEQLGESSLDCEALLSLGLSADMPVAVGLPIAGDPSGVPISATPKFEMKTGVVALDQTSLLVNSFEFGWTVVSCQHTVTHQDFNFAREEFTKSLASATEYLASADLVADDEATVRALNEFKLTHLPPSISKKHLDAMDLAAKVNIVAQRAITDSIVFASPSKDAMRIQVLQQLHRSCQRLLQASAIC
jgi:hypothetical protein